MANSNIYGGLPLFNANGGGSSGSGVYRGTWDAATNTPTLANGSGEVGDYWINTAAGTNLVDFGAGDVSFEQYDIAKYSGSIWENAGSSSGSVLSWNSLTGAVVAPMSSLSDVSAPTPLNSEILIYNGTSSQYVNQSLSGEAIMDEVGAVTLQGSPTFTAVNADTFNVGGTDFTLSLLGSVYPLLKFSTVSNLLYNNVDDVLTTTINNFPVLISNVNGTTLTSNQNQVAIFQAGNTGPSGTTSTNFKIQENILTPLYWDVGIIGSGGSISSGTGNFYLSSDGSTNQFQLDQSGNMTLAGFGYATNFTSGLSTVVSSPTPIILTNASVRSWVISGTNVQPFNLPDATSIPIGATFIFNNNSTGGSATINNYNSGGVVTVARGAWVSVILTDNSGGLDSSGVWDYHSQLPSGAIFGLTGLTYSGGTVSFANGNFSATTNQITLGASAHQTIVNAPAPSVASVTFTIPNSDNSNSVIPSVGDADYYARGINLDGEIQYDTIDFLNLTGTAAVAQGGTGQTTYTDGQLLIGNSTGNTLTKSTLTAGSGITITNGSGSITISSPDSGLTWNSVTGTSATLAINNGYIINNAGLVTLTLPTTAAIGDVISIRGLGAGGFTVVYGSGQMIHVSPSTSTTTTGSISSTNRYDSFDLTCVVANTEFNVTALQSSGLTIV